MVKVLSGQTKVEVIPESGSLKLKVNGQIQAINKGKLFVVKDNQTSETITEIKYYQDGVYQIYAPLQFIHVITDGKRVEIVAPQLLKNRALGLCGNMNGEEVADLTTPNRCIMQPKLVAFSYMLNKNGNEPMFAQCPKAAQTDLAAYQREEQICTKEEIVKTPIIRIFDQTHKRTLGFKQQMNKLGVCSENENLNVLGNYKQMVKNGWRFDLTHDGLKWWDLTYKSMRPFCGTGNNWYGWSSLKKVGTLSTVLKGSGKLTLNFGNCWHLGIVAVYLNKQLMAVAHPKTKKEVSLSFKQGALLEIKDEGLGSVIQLNSINFECKKENKESKFVIGPKGSGTCSEGSPITDEMTCRKACRSLNIPEQEILGNHKCYIDRFGDCYQNGRHQSGSDSGSSLICRTSEQSAEGGAGGLGSGYGSELGSGVQGVEGEGGRSCDPRISYHNNPACEPGEICVGEPRAYSGECRSGAIGRRSCDPRISYNNNPACEPGEICVGEPIGYAGECRSANGNSGIEMKGSYGGELKESCKKEGEHCKSINECCSRRCVVSRQGTICQKPVPECPPLSPNKGRCGPSWGGRCNHNLADYAIYCNEDNGWCGSTSDHEHAQSSDMYDWEPKSCKIDRKKCDPRKTYVRNGVKGNPDCDPLGKKCVMVARWLYECR